MTHTDRTYKDTLKDYLYLWDTYGGALPVDGFSTDLNDLSTLLKAPTMAIAAKLMRARIRQWFFAGPVLGIGSDQWKMDPVVENIAKKHDCMTDYKRIRTQ